MVKFDIEGVKYSVPSGWKDVTLGDTFLSLTAWASNLLRFCLLCPASPKMCWQIVRYIWGAACSRPVSFYHDGSIEAFAVTDKTDIDIKALTYRHFEFANIQIKNWWNALPRKRSNYRI